jgi:hypothetical protein
LLRADLWPRPRRDAVASSMSPSEASWISASRKGVRETPNSASSTASSSRLPGAYSPIAIFSRWLLVTGRTASVHVDSMGGHMRMRSPLTLGDFVHLALLRTHQINSGLIMHANVRGNQNRTADGRGAAEVTYGDDAGK